jgi:hypothetical protein
LQLREARPPSRSNKHANVCRSTKREAINYGSLNEEASKLLETDIKEVVVGDMWESPLVLLSAHLETAVQNARIPPMGLGRL